MQGGPLEIKGKFDEFPIRRIFSPHILYSPTVYHFPCCDHHDSNVGLFALAMWHPFRLKGEKKAHLTPHSRRATLFIAYNDLAMSCVSLYCAMRIWSLFADRRSDYFGPVVEQETAVRCARYAAAYAAGDCIASIAGIIGVRYVRWSRFHCQISTTHKLTRSLWTWKRSAGSVAFGSF
jgi:Cell fusion glycoprotein K